MQKDEVMKSLKETIMDRDGLTEAEADADIREAQERVRQGEDPEEILYEEFGLEPDYFWDLL